MLLVQEVEQRVREEVQAFKQAQGHEQELWWGERA